MQLYGELKCPLDDFELILISFGSGNKVYPCCPFCYNYPTLEGMKTGLLLFAKFIRL
jgi:DNA topoisomerase III